MYGIRPFYSQGPTKQHLLPAGEGAKKPEEGASKRAGEMDDAQGLGVDLDDIEAGGDIKAVVSLQISLGGPGQKVLF